MHPVDLAQGVLATRLPNAIFLRVLRFIEYVNTQKAIKTGSSWLERPVLHIVLGPNNETAESIRNIDHDWLDADARLWCC